MTADAKIWIVDDDKSIRWVLERALEQAGISTRSFESAQALLECLQREQPEAIISDIRMPGIDGLTLLTRINDAHPGLPVIITTAHSDLDSAVASYQHGAFEYLPKPFDVDEVVAVCHRALVPTAEESGESPELVRVADTGIIGKAPAMQEVFRAIGRLAHSSITVLISGESGTGKELVARALHRHSPRQQQDFIALNMAAIPRELLESELFGHEKGAFTGANVRRQGRFEQANKGTLFLDEIGDMPADTQTRLLRVLEDGEFYRVGGHAPVQVDVRIIAATHQDLKKLVSERRFREDLYHRLNVIRIQLPRLAERREDIPHLARHFLQRVAAELKVEPKLLLPEASDYLCQLPWPGNVRELENTCRGLTVMAAGREIHRSDLAPEADRDKAGADTSHPHWQQQLLAWAEQVLRDGQQPLLQRALPEFERVMIEAALRHSNGNKREAARVLGWGRNTLTRKMQGLGMS